jgi:hypothetical protein
MRREPFVARLAQSLVITFAIAQWCVSVLGIARMDLVVLITFAWAAATARRLVGPAPQGPFLVPGRRVEVLVSALGGQVMWILLPVLRRAEPEGWIWQPLPIGAAASAAGALVLVGCALYPFFKFFVLGRGPRTSASAPELDAPLLCFGLFLVSGSLVFAGVAIATVAAMSLQVFRAGTLEPASAPPRTPQAEAGELAHLSY